MAPTKDAPIVRFDPETGERRLEVAKWGLVPMFTKKPVKARKPINARCETVARSPLFKEAFARRRCLVPAAAYYEWRHDPSGKTPFAIARHDGAPVALGGMWEEWQADGETLRTFATLTTDANPPLSLIQERMPVGSSTIRARPERSEQGDCDCHDQEGDDGREHIPPSLRPISYVSRHSRAVTAESYS